MVHAYTASGAVLALAMTVAVIHNRYRTAFLLMVAATVIDGTDGLFARIARVKERTPEFDGGRLDDIVDYLTFVFVPVLLVLEAGLLADGWGGVAAAAVLLSSAYGFAAKDAKTDDYFFTGFPSYWNVVALYLFAAKLPPVLNSVILLGLSVLVFVRIGYVYPSRTPILRGLTIALCLAWGLMLLQIIATLPDVSARLLIVSLFFPVYYFVLSLILQSRRVRQP
jgi:phosphatidylcholine synthase